MCVCERESADVSVMPTTLSEPSGVNLRVPLCACVRLRTCGVYVAAGLAVAVYLCACVRVCVCACVCVRVCLLWKRVEKKKKQQ